MRRSCLILMGFVLCVGWLGAGVNAWSKMGLEGGSIKTLTVDPTDSATVYAGTYSGGLYQSQDGGAHWRELNAGLPGLSIGAVAVAPTMPSTLYVAVSGYGVYKSTDRGGRWQAVNQGLVNPDITVLIRHTTDSRTLLAGTRGSGVFHHLFLRC